MRVDSLPIISRCGREDGNAYINFVLYAVLGKMAEADEIMRNSRIGIARVAAALALRYPIKPTPLYRGMLIDLDAPLAIDDRYTFVSWSEDRRVALWFAHPTSIISQPLAASNHRLSGAVLELQRPDGVLFHHSWAVGWERLAVMHPHMGPDGARQIRWNLAIQREVITTTPDGFPPAMPIDDASPPVEQLDAWFSPPWL